MEAMMYFMYFLALYLVSNFGDCYRCQESDFDVVVSTVSANSVTFDICYPESIDSIHVNYRLKESYSYSDKSYTKLFQINDTYEVEDLQAGETYEFSFSVKSMKTEKEKLTTKKFITVTLLPAKPEVIFYNLEGDRVKIEWILNGSAVDQYQIKYFSVQRGRTVLSSWQQLIWQPSMNGKEWRQSLCSVTVDLSFCSAESLGYSYTIAGLHPKTYYELQLRAHTETGFGEAYKNKFYIA